MSKSYLVALLPLFVGCAGANVNAASGDGSIGADLYASYCSSCHGANAQGGSGPSLGGIGDSNGVVNTILYGTEGMPGFMDSLSDQDISDILAYLGGLSGGGGGGEGGEGGEDD